MPSTSFSVTDTIVAIATPAGRGALGVIRLSGPDAHRIACTLVGRSAPLEPRRATFTHIRRLLENPDLDVLGGERAPQAPSIDQVLATFFPSPASYTGQDVVELSAHGSPIVLRQIIDVAVAAGARLAEPGEFTLRAFLNGKIDLVQAEAVADLIDSVTPLQARAAFDQLEGTLTEAISAIDARLFDLIARLEASLDFPDEGYHFVDPGDLLRELDEIIRGTRALLQRAETGRLIREGLQVVIVGKANVGKSTLFNTLAGAGRAIVTPRPGTTRDLLTETVDLGGLKVTLVDTAGIRQTDDEVEQEGVARARRAQDVAGALIVVLDGSQPLDSEDLSVLANARNERSLFVINKMDVGSAWCAAEVPALRDRAAVSVSLQTGDGVEAMKATLLQAVGVDGVERDPVRVTNARHIGLLTNVVEALGRAGSAVAASRGTIPEEFVLDDLHAAREKLEQVRGQRAPEAVLQEIFSRFCIGK